MTTPSQASLDALFARATRVRVLECGASDGKPLGGPVLVDVTGEDVERVRAHLRIVESPPGGGFHCMCLGDLAIELVGGPAGGSAAYREERITTLGFHHARSVRHAAWNSDALLVDGPALVKWLATQGAPGPLRAHEEDVARMKRADGDRRRWLQATPPCFADLGRWESRGLPPLASYPAYDEPEAKLRASYATTEDAVRALLGWYGSGAGPWSGYPSYEDFPEKLLHRLGLDVARAVALSCADDDALVLRGAARLFSSWHLVAHQKSAVGDVPEALWKKMRPHVQAMHDADVTARFDHAVGIAAEIRNLRAQGAPKRSGKGLATVAVSENGTLSGLCSDGARLYAGEANDIVAFDLTTTRGKPIFRGKDPYFEMAGPISKMLMVAHINAGTIGKVLTDGSDLIVMARDQARPVNVVVSPGTIAWLNAAQVPDPVRGAPYVVQQTSVMLFDAESPRVVRVAEKSAFSLVIDAEHLWWVEVEPASTRWELWCFAHHRADPPHRVAVMGAPRSMGLWHPKLAVNATHVLWANPDERAIFAVDKRATSVDVAPTILAKTKHPPAQVGVDDLDVFALTGDPDSRKWHVEHAAARSLGDRSTVIADYERQLWDRPAMSLDARGLFFTTNDRVLSLPRS